MLGASRENGSAVRAYRAILDPHRTPPQGIAASPVKLGAPVRNRHPSRGYIRPTRFRGPCTARSPSSCRAPTATKSAGTRAAPTGPTRSAVTHSGGPRSAIGSRPAPPAPPATPRRTAHSGAAADRHQPRGHPRATTGPRAVPRRPAHGPLPATRPHRPADRPPQDPTATGPTRSPNTRDTRRRTALSAPRRPAPSLPAPSRPQRPVEALTTLVAHQPRPQRRHVRKRAPHPPQRGTGRAEGREGVEPYGNRTGPLPGFPQQQRPRPTGEASTGLLTCGGAMGI